MHKPGYKSSANFQKHYIKCFTRTQFNVLLALINNFCSSFCRSTQKYVSTFVSIFCVFWWHLVYIALHQNLIRYQFVLFNKVICADIFINVSAAYSSGSVKH